MDNGEGFLDGSDEALAVGFDHGFFGPAAQVRDRLVATAAGTDNSRHLLCDGLTVSHPEGIGIANGTANAAQGIWLEARQPFSPLISR